MTASIFVIMSSSPVLRSSATPRRNTATISYQSLSRRLPIITLFAVLGEIQSLRSFLHNDSSELSKVHKNEISSPPRALATLPPIPPHSTVPRQPHGNRNYLSCRSGFVIEGLRT